MKQEITNQYTNLIFDFGGVVTSIDFNNALESFRAIGMTDAEEMLNPYKQAGFFGELEDGTISDQEFLSCLSAHVGHTISWTEAQKAYRGFIPNVPERNLKALLQLRAEHYRLILLSNTNPFIMGWAMSNEFDGKGHSLRHYFDAFYLSHERGIMKPDPRIFKLLLKEQNVKPENCIFIDDGPRNAEAARQLGIRSICPEGGTDWIAPLRCILEHEA